VTRKRPGTQSKNVTYTDWQKGVVPVKGTREHESQTHKRRSNK